MLVLLTFNNIPLSIDFAIIKLSGAQELVKKGDEIVVNRLQGNVRDKLTFEEVLLTSKKGKIDVGTPTVKGAKVQATIVEHLKGQKVRKKIFKAKARYRRHVGHRQAQTKLLITNI